MLDSGNLLIDPNSALIDWYDERTYALQELAPRCGYKFSEDYQILEKAVILLRRGANVLCWDPADNTLLRTVLGVRPGRAWLSPAQKREHFGDEREGYRIPIEESQEVLIAFISAGADVYATNNTGQPPSVIAWLHGREKDWIHALTVCGFDADEVFTHSDCFMRQVSTLTFQEYYQRRQEGFVWYDKDICEEAAKKSQERWISEDPRRELFYKRQLEEAGVRSAIDETAQFELIGIDDEDENSDETESDYDHHKAMEYDVESVESDCNRQGQEEQQKSPLENVTIGHDANASHHEADGNQNSDVQLSDDLGLEAADGEVIDLDRMDFDGMYDDIFRQFVCFESEFGNWEWGMSSGERNGGRLVMQ